MKKYTQYKGLSYADDKLLKGITKITRKEEEITPNTLFFSFGRMDSTTYLRLKMKGAALIVGEANLDKEDYIQVLSIKKAYQEALCLDGKKKLKGKIMIGVTGTNGKTSVSTMLYEFLKNNNQAIYFGSNGIYKGHKHIKSTNTTPSMEELLANLGEEKYVIMEISTIGFLEYRTFGLTFNYIVLTNIYLDHLEYHKTEYDYYYTKLLILATSYSATAFISTDIKDNNVLRLNHQSFYYGIESNLFRIRILDDGIRISDSVDTIIIKPECQARYNYQNILAAVSLLHHMGYTLSLIDNFFKNFLGVPGRMKYFYFNQKTIIIDYPHTASAYSALLEYVSSKYSRIIVILGAGGNRDNHKREDYARIVSKKASYAIITNDNPRDEDEYSIANELQRYMTIENEIIIDRKKAIREALAKLNDYDVLLILGKGDEDYIQIGNEKIPHNDIKYVEELIK